MINNRARKFRSSLLSWAEGNLREFSWRESDLPIYEVFIAEFLLTQTPAENVAKVYPDFIKSYPSLTAINAADRSELVNIIEPLGFYNMRADALKKIASEYETLPVNETELVKLPRVGPYVANATLCFALERPLPIVDRNVVRTYRRVFGEEFPESDSDQREFAAAMLPEGGRRARSYNLALLDFGALVCTSDSPLCSECFASSHCTYFQK